VQGLAGVSGSVVDAQTEYDKFSKKLNNASDNLSSLTGKFTELTNEIQKQVGISLNLKPLEESSSKLKDTTDDILARARQFVKEFGEVFVLPDLEETFFKGKKQLLPIAQELLDNVSKGNLKLKIPIETELAPIKTVEQILDEVTGKFKTVSKIATIKIPVITEIDFLPEATPLTKDQLDKLTDNFFKGLQLENGIPVEITVDPTLSVDSRKLIDQKLDIRQKFKDFFGDLGLKQFATIDFSNLTKGIQDANKQFNNMLELANTLNQAVGQGLTNAFNQLFDAMLEGKNVFKALGEGLKQLIIGTIKAIAQMLILKIVTQIIFKGGGAALGGGGGSPFRVPGSNGLVAAPSFGGVSGGGAAAPTLIAQVSGTQLQFVLTQGANQISRVR